ncbi:hypothetical protein ACHAXA_007494 [Cyclostephanos tholiformis]|uniref:Sulfotransferase n=1 Tax=Cyclostephanos tholiformis TaxID=382380 RepID=A0ABD3RDJ1_9STRA
MQSRWKIMSMRSLLLTLAATIVACVTIQINILATMSDRDDDSEDVVFQNSGFRRILERSVVASSSGAVTSSSSDVTDAGGTTKRTPSSELDVKTDGSSSTRGSSRRHGSLRYHYYKGWVASDQEDWTCDAQNEPDLLPEGDITRRAFHAVIIGAMKGGTQALMKAILSHKRMMNAGMLHGELHLLNNKGMMKNLREFKHPPDGSSVIRRRHLREGFEWLLRARDFDSEDDIAADVNADKLGIHSAPVYLFSGRSVPARLMCVAPWSRAIAILRNPIDRAFSHYNYVHKYIELHGETLFNGTRFEDFIYGDIWLLRKTGVLRDWQSEADFESFSGSAEEFRAWEMYLKHWELTGRPPGIWGPVGRGLYAIQIEIWVDETNKINRTDNLLILESEDFRGDGVGIYHRVAQYLGLERQKASRHVVGREHHRTVYVHDGMSEEIYTSLYELFRPYNKRLYKLLGKLGEDDWDGVWDKPRDVRREEG